MVRVVGSLIIAICAATICSCVALTDASAECVPSDFVVAAEPASAAEGVVGETLQDRAGRMVVPLSINGEGPFRFIVDTGANRTALSLDLAAQLGLTPTETGELHYIHGVETTPIVPAQLLQFGRFRLPTTSMPLLGGPMLAGEAGLLGADGMQDWRLRMDFEHQCIEIAPSTERFRAGGWTTVRGRTRFGNLVVIPGTIRDRAVNVLIDTGSDSSLANFALRDLFSRTGEAPSADVREYTAGDPVVLDTAIRIPSLQLGGVEIAHVTAFVGDFHIFRLWGFGNEPTLLIGMDVLTRTRALVIDFRRGTAYFRLNDQTRTGSRLRGTRSIGGMTVTRAN